MNTILDYEKLVYKIIRRYSYNMNDIDDLYQVGMIALDKALKNYNKDLNCQFSTYAYLYIKGEVLKYIRENKVIKVSKDTIKLNTLINKTKDYLEQKYSRSVSLNEIASFLEIPIEKVSDTIISNEYVKSLEYTLNEEGKDLNLYDTYGYEEKDLDENILDLRDELNKLDDFDRKLINLRYYRGLTQQETSEELGLSQVQISRKENKILTKLNSRLSV